MGRYENKGRAMFDSITSLFIFLFSGVGIVTFWIFLSRGTVYDNWYPLVGHFVASHGAFIAIIFYEYLKYKNLTVAEWFANVRGNIKERFRRKI